MTDDTTLTADETIALLRDDPAQADAVAADEATRDHPRKTVLAAVEEARGSFAPVDDYPERPLSEALSDDAKGQLVKQGYADGEGSDWHLLDPSVLPGV